MNEQRKKTEREGEQQRTRRKRKERREWAERYEGRPVYPEPEPKGSYKP